MNADTEPYEAAPLPYAVATVPTDAEQTAGPLVRVPVLQTEFVPPNENAYAADEVTKPALQDNPPTNPQIKRLPIGLNMSPAYECTPQTWRTSKSSTLADAGPCLRTFEPSRPTISLKERYRSLSLPD